MRHILETAISCGVGIASIAVASSASAAVTQFSDRTAFSSATDASTVETFLNEGHSPIASGVLNSSTSSAGVNPGDILSGVTYSTEVFAGSDFFFNIDFGAGYAGGFLDSLYLGGAHRTLTVDFDNAQSAFGFDTNRLMGGFTVNIFDSAGQIFTANYAAPAGIDMTFFGYQNDAATIRKVTIQGSGFFDFALDNFTFNGTAVSGAVPESATWMMMLAGFGFTGGAMRYRRRKTAVSFG